MTEAGPISVERRPPEFNLSGVKLVMQSDVNHQFSGVMLLTVREWVEMVKMYFIKRNTPKHARHIG